MIRLLWCSIAVASAIVLMAAGGSTHEAPQFDGGCTLPFDATKIRHDIDDNCGIQGQFSQERFRVQNLAKNNFCATGTAALATFVTFDKLHKAAKDAGFSLGGPSSPLADRTPYANLGYVSSEGDTLGEGSLVHFAGYIVHADYSNDNSGGENVNCNHGGEDWNDVHINIASNKSEDDFCKTVVVEMSPHSVREPTRTRRRRCGSTSDRSGRDPVCGRSEKRAGRDNGRDSAGRQQIPGNKKS